MEPQRLPGSPLHEDQKTALLLATRVGHAEVVAQLLARGADIEARTEVCCPLESYGY